MPSTANGRKSEAVGQNHVADQHRMTTGELARATGVSSDALRYYEQNGLLPVPAKTATGQRRYATASVERVQMVRAALAFGFTVKELTEVFEKRDRGEAPCENVYALAQAKLTDLGVRIRQMQTLRRVMQRTLRDWKGRLQKTPGRQRAGLLVALAQAYPGLAAQGSPQLSPGLRHHNQKQRIK